MDLRAAHGWAGFQAGLSAGREQLAVQAGAGPQQAHWGLLWSHDLGGGWASDCNLMRNLDFLSGSRSTVLGLNLSKTLGAWQAGAEVVGTRSVGDSASWMAYAQWLPRPKLAVYAGLGRGFSGGSCSVVAGTSLRF